MQYETPLPWYKVIGWMGAAVIFLFAVTLLYMITGFGGCIAPH